MKEETYQTPTLPVNMNVEVGQGAEGMEGP